LVVADTSIDPHRLVRFCCERAGSEGLDVSLLVPVDDETQPWSESCAAATRLLGRAAALLDAAGVRLEEVTTADEDAATVGALVRSGAFDALLVCAAEEKASSAVLAIAVRQARVYGLPVIGTARHGGQPSWLRRVVEPLLHWPHPN
jgi:hypothetical protein